MILGYINSVTAAKRPVLELVFLDHNKSASTCSHKTSEKKNDKTFYLFLFKSGANKSTQRVVWCIIEPHSIRLFRSLTSSWFLLPSEACNTRKKTSDRSWSSQLLTLTKPGTVLHSTNSCSKIVQTSVAKRDDKASSSTTKKQNRKVLFRKVINS